MTNRTQGNAHVTEDIQPFHPIQVLRLNGNNTVGGAERSVGCVTAAEVVTNRGSASKFNGTLACEGPVRMQGLELAPDLRTD